MARALFTTEQVYAAADALAAQGKEVTALALLSKLGGGSLTTIYKHLIAWRESRQQESLTTAQDIPETVQTAFSSALGVVWKAATSESAREVVAAKERAAEQVQFANKQFEEAMQAIERLEEQADNDESKIESLTARIGQLEVAMHKSESEGAALKATNEELRHQVKSQETQIERMHRDSESQREKAEKQVERLQEELRCARAEREAAVKEASEARGQVAALKDQGNQLLARLGPRKPGKG